ncbi:multidrug resistance-associated ABC transporter [Gymnopilus junonius]|uniref:Multidrug resistance-associated ABC transporter n=1 Tax=Gymnopilus junonius TaxID=109634 RepID=A0A9P5THA9_GYMJU|nr:multidrug resistance-associated ABC transporter [Gymnopilus junonius]
MPGPLDSAHVFPHSQLLEETRVIPFAVTCITFVSLFLHILVSAIRKRRINFNSGVDDEDDTTRRVSMLHKLKKHVRSYGGYTIFAFMFLRLAGCVALLAMSVVTLRSSGCAFEAKDTDGSWIDRNLDALAECPELLTTISYSYASLLALVAITWTKWRNSATRYNVLLLTSAGLVYAYRDVWPLATYDQRPEDEAEGKTLFAKLAVLAFTSLFIPLFIPRQYVPIDPKNPMSEPNPEQTASIFSMMTYIFLDPVIMLGYRVPHLSADQLPPLADYDRAKYRTEKAFPHLDTFHGAKRRSLFFGLMRVYRTEYVVLASMVIFYMETGGDDATVQLWFWIIWLFVGPMLQSLAWQWYIFIATRTLTRTEGLITQLVFEHSLRIRLKAETSEDADAKPKDAPSTPALPTPSGSSAATPDNASQKGTDADTGNRLRVENASEASQTSTAVTSREASAASSQATVTASPSSILKGKGKGKDMPAEPKKEEKKKASDGNLVGKINNLVTTDLNNIVSGRDFLLVVLYVPVQIIFCVVFLYKVLGWSAFVGIGIMVALFPAPGYVAKILSRTQKERLKLLTLIKTDARVQAVSEMVNVLRMAREEELKRLWKVKLLDQANGLMSYFFPTLTMLGTYMTYTVVMKGQLNASIIFSSMSVFDMLREQLSRLLWQGTTIIQAKVSLDRVQEFLNKTELLDSFTEKSSTDSQALTAPSAMLNPEIGFRNATFSWSLEDEDGSATPSSRIFKLRVNGELLFKRDAINLIIGPTGSGKTSILMALLGELHFIPEGPDSWFNLPRDGGVAYAAQESWVQNETIRNNILFGSPYDEERYRKVIKQCALERDLELFEAGDATEVGERGLTLSGGQKARVTLARAIYSPAKVILLDDVLAALDVHTSAWIIDQCFRGDLIKDRTILLVTHNIALASPVAEFVVSIGLDGRVQSQGTEIALALAKNPTLAAEAEEDREVTEIAKEEIDTPEAKPKPADGKLVIAEEINVGHVTWRSVKLLITSLGGDHTILFFVFVIGSFFINEWSLTFQTWFLGYWGSQYETHPPSEVDISYYLTVYTTLLLATFLFYAVTYIFYNYGTLRASRTINTKLISSILTSTFRWLDETPTARIITRCTQDIYSIDGPVPQTLLWLLDLASGMITKLGAVALFTPIFIFPGIGVAAVGFFLGNMYLKAQLSVKRETSNARSPMLAHFSAAIHGLVSIRAYGAQEVFKRESLARIDKFTRVSRMSHNLNRWVGVRIDSLGALFTVALAIFLVYGPPVGAANTGFTLNMAVGFTSVILVFVRIYNAFEVNANSLERIQGYIDIDHEPEPTEAGVPPAAWPTSGTLRAEKLSARYSQTGPKVLHELSFEIQSGQRIGIVGRTGSGKSSLTLALLRCILTEGTVLYDGLETSKLNLDALRSNITIIPQTPELLSGTLRQNLDPFEQNDDATLNDALRAAGLFSLQDESDEARITLDSKISGGGTNLSVGQRQIIALARAMVRGSKLLILDEATSAIDYKTDAIIQSTLRSQLGNDVTVITVAHRLQTIMDADQIMVLDDGHIVEFGKPKDLLQNEAGMLRALVDGSGDKDNLYSLAGASS